MTNHFNNKYRVGSARLQTWNYGWNAAYFVTICTKDMQSCFGNIVNGIVHLSGLGVIADVLWYEIKNHAQHVELGSFVVMPNHVHGIIILNNPGDGLPPFDGEPPTIVETGHALSLPTTPGQQRFRNQGKNTLSSIVGGYKSAVSKHAHRLQFNFRWQTRFHDHIIRDEKSFNTISSYIISNPANWQKDKFFG